MPAPQKIRELIRTFRNNIVDYKATTFNEAQLRQQFINPMFRTLGWDMDNEQGYAEAYKDVIHEASLKMGEAVKAPDYCFRIGSTPKFYLEAKKPAVNVKEDAAPALQVRSYGWTKGLPLSILTDFEEFAVYDCRVEPLEEDDASVARISYLRFEEYDSKWDEIADVFSRDAILKGSFDRYVDSAKLKRGTASFDVRFLEDIENWRLELAKNIALRNPEIGTRELNYAVQITIDRIIFLRMCESRGIEPFDQLRELQSEEDIYQELYKLYRKADQRYNSGLFHFEKEADRPEEHDTLTPHLQIDDKVLKSIISYLYVPKRRYAFSAMPADILGQIYEQFLGKVIRLTESHQARVEEKPEVKKAGGVYYTPSYIVNYIVERTVGKLLEGKTQKQAAKVRVLDPACGSGSFLLGAYEYLLKWHLSYYMDNGPKNFKKEIYEGVGGWRLTSAERKRILVNNIYGVDIDSQAVEVTKLSLLLKVLEGESEESLNQQLKFAHERALPDLASNIKCGNSLIGPDFYIGQQGILFDEDEKFRINVFNWNKGFPEIVKAGGFDVVIGNPPYIQQSMMEYYNKNVSNYYIGKYSSTMGRFNTFGLFIEAVLLRMLKSNGYLSFIVPNTILTQEYYQSLRLQMLSNTIVSLTSYLNPVFHNAVVETAVFVLLKAKSPEGGNTIDIVYCDNQDMIYTTHPIQQSNYLTSHKNAFLVRADSASLGFKEKLDRSGVVLESIANINQAIALKEDRAASLFSKPKGKNYKKVIDGRHINRYQLDWGGEWLAYDVNKIHSCKRTDIFEASEKIFFRRVGDRLIATIDEHKYYALNTLVVITPRVATTESLKYWLALINSQLLNFYYVHYLKSTKKVFSEIQARQLAQLPICRIDFSNKATKRAHDSIVQYVDSILASKKKLAAAKTPHEKSVLQAQIDSTDRQIDQLVYELYGLTEAEIKIVEAATT